MRKKISAIILVCLIALLACALVACNKDGSQYVEEVPSIIGENIDAYGNETYEIDGGYASIQFSFTKEMSSVFNLVVVDPDEGYDVSTINYSIIYTKGAVTSVTPDTPLSIDYIDSEDVPLLKQKGHHTIHVSIPYAGTILKSSFALHLRYAYEEVEYKTLTFSTNGGTPHFATATDNKVSIQVEKGLTFTYDEFYRNFTITKEKQAIEYFAVTSGNSIKRLQRVISKSDSSTTSNQITIEDDTTFVVNWTDNTVKVTFSVVAPKDEKGNSVSPAAGMTTPVVEDQYVEISVGTVVRPVIDMNVYDGFYFAGWYDKATDKVWNFTVPVNEDNIELYSKWTTRYYSFSLYTMSGTFKSDLDDSYAVDKSGSIQLQSIDVAKAKGYLVAESMVIFNASNGYPLRIDVSGLSYGAKYSDYVTEMQIDANDSSKTVIIILSDLCNAFEKPIDSEILEDKIVADDEFYTSSACKEDESVESTAKITDDLVLYVKWELNAKTTDANYNEVINEFYTKLLFKDGLQIKSDGSVAITDIADETFSYIEIPDTIYYAGKDRYVSEFSSNSLMNYRSLGKLDLSKASHLEVIGSEAFVNCTGLYSIIWPDNNIISSVGKRAFANTYLENNYQYDFIIINGILYKYIDKSTKEAPIKELDLSVDNYYSYPSESDFSTTAEYEAAKNEIDKLNVELKNVTIISEEAFEDGLYLEKVTLPNKVVEIGKNAFANLSKLSYIGAPATLLKVSSTAFADTKLISEKYTETEDDNNTIQLSAKSIDKKYSAIKVGNVLVKMLDTDMTDLIISKDSGIESFAEGAFVNCKNLATIQFTGEAESSIKYIGANAFSSALGYIKQEVNNGFTVINKILTEYYNIDRSDVNIVIGSNVETIGQYAFNSYARHVETVEIGANVKHILEYAFAGATKLRGVLLSNVQVVDNQLVNLPEIEALSFADSNGELINGIDLYFYQTAYDYLNSLTSAKMAEIYETASSSYYNKLLDWYNLFTLHNDNFKVEKIEKVYINTDVIDSMYVISDSYSWSNVVPQDIDGNGVVLQTSAGVKKYERFEIDTLIGDFEYTKEGEWSAEISRKSDWGDATLVQFKYKVIFAVKGEPYSFYDSNDKTTIIDGNSLSSSGVFWVTGFDGDVLSSAIPTYYTSRTSLDIDAIELNYKTTQPDEQGSYIHKIIASEYTDFAPNANATNTIYFTFDFNGAGYYRVAFKYKGVDSKVKEIKQADSISIPLNASVLDALNNSTVYYYGEDGSVVEEYINMNDYDIYSVNGNTEVLSLISNTLGLNTIKLKYIGSKKVTSDLKDVEIVYSVVLEGDSSQFVFEIKKGGAVITNYRNNTIETLVIPSSYVKNGIEYDVTEISDGVFANYSKLTTVYLPSTIKTIGANAFKGCSQLKNIYSSESTENVQTKIADSNFTVLTKQIVQYGTIHISNVDITTGSIVIPTTLVVTSTSHEAGIDEDITTTSYVTPIFDENAFDAFSNGVIYLDYTENNINFVKKYLLDSKENIIENIEVVFMFNSTDKPTSYNTEEIEFLQYTEANRAFVNGLKNPKDDKGNDIDMDVNYLFYYVISDSQPRKTSTTQRHFTYDESTISVESQEIYQTRKLESLYLDETAISTIVVGDEYVKEETTDDGIKITTISKTVETADVIKANLSSFIVYLPDTVFNTCVIKNDAGIEQEVIVYKHGEELLYSTNNYVSASIEYIGNGAFESCVLLETIDLSMATKLADLGAGAFSKSGIKSIDLSSTIIKEINSQTFQDCSSLVTVELSDQTTYIGSYAFDGCTKLELDDVFFKYIKQIDTCAFTRCDSLNEINLLVGSIEVMGATVFSDSDITINVTFAKSNTPSGWNSSWYGFCKVVYGV